MRDLVLRSAWVVAVLGAAAPLYAGDPGDLFPNVSYEQAMQNATTGTAKPPAHRTHKPPPTASATAPAPPATAPAAIPPVSAPPVPTPPASPSKPSAPSAHELENAPTEAPPFWSPYSARLLAPLLTADEKTQFDATFGDLLTHARSDEQRVAAAETLAAAADPAQPLTPALRRYVLMQALTLAVHGRASVATREHLASQFLPLVQLDHTLPATDAKATALSTLANSGTAKAPATPKLLYMTAQAYSDLALAQIQAGYPAQAQESLVHAQSWLEKLKPPEQPSYVQLTAVEYYLVHAQQARVLAPKLKQTLTDTPNDPAANTQLATLHLSLFGDVAGAADCAAKSDKPQLKGLAKFVAALPGGLDAVDPATPQGLATSLDLCRGLLNTAAVCADSFDRYAIALYVKDQCDELTGKYSPDTPSRNTLQFLGFQARSMIAANPPPPFTIVAPPPPANDARRR